jgi:hypothetical protein
MRKSDSDLKIIKMLLSKGEGEELDKDYIGKFLTEK